MTGDVFEKDPFGGTFPDNAGDLGPEVTGIIGPTALASGAEGLTRISRENGVEGTVEGPGIEAAQIIPDGCRGEVSRALGRDEDCARPFFPLDKGAGVIGGLSEHDAQIQASAACAEG